MKFYTELDIARQQTTYTKDWSKTEGGWHTSYVAKIYSFMDKHLDKSTRIFINGHEYQEHTYMHSSPIHNKMRWDNKFNKFVIVIQVPVYTMNKHTLDKYFGISDKETDDHTFIAIKNKNCIYMASCLSAYFDFEDLQYLYFVSPNWTINYA